MGREVILFVAKRRGSRHTGLFWPCGSGPPGCQCAVFGAAKRAAEATMG